MSWKTEASWWSRPTSPAGNLSDYALCSLFPVVCICARSSFTDSFSSVIRVNPGLPNGVGHGDCGSRGGVVKGRPEFDQG